jgi:hypothetical protein
LFITFFGLLFRLILSCLFVPLSGCLSIPIPFSSCLPPPLQVASVYVRSLTVWWC